MNIFGLDLIWQCVLFVLVGAYIQITAAMVCTQLPKSFFKSTQFPYKLYAWEKSGTIYEKFLIKKWKKHLPDAASWIKGEFTKKHLLSTEKEYLQTFIIESCRAEWAHWVQVAGFMVFFVLLNPILALLANGYSLMANLPCIVAQRYNRPRFERFLALQERILQGRNKADIDERMIE